MKELFNKNEKAVNRILFCVFCFSLIIISLFHEPWFDEAQAWMIARDASLYELLFVMPHYEGHPALWSLLLAVPAKLGVPFEIGLKIIGFIITSVSTYLIIFKSPFPKCIKYFLPFSFFFFYQGGVIVRPYAFLILVLSLLGYFFNKRNERPFLFSFLLFLLCCTSAYGIVFACGIALCIVAEIINEKGLKHALSEIFKDKRTLSLVFLLIGAVLLILQIMPFEDTFVATVFSKNSFIVTLLCSIFTMIGDCFLTRSLWFYFDRTLLQTADIPWYSLLSCIVIGIIIWICIYCVSGRKSFYYFLIPYLLFAVFSAVVYFNGHHLICAFALFIYWLWIVFDDNDKYHGWKLISSRLFNNDKDKALLTRFLQCFVAVCLGFSIYWTISSSIMDIVKEYSYGRSTSNFIKNNQLDDTYIVGAWEVKGSDIEGNDYTNMVATAVPINAYFDRNIAFNLNNGNHEKGFMYYRVPSKQENDNNYALIKEKGLPDLMLGKPDLKKIFEDETDIDCYTTIYYMPINYIWKGDKYSAYLPLMIRNDLLDKYNLSEAPIPDDANISSFELTEEQIQLYNEGKITIEDIVGSN